MLRLDEKDLRILEILQSDGRAAVKRIAREVGSPVSTVHSRIKRLERAGVIRGYRAVLDPRLLGLPVTAFILARVAYRVPGEEAEISQREVAARVARFREIQEVHIVAGEWDLLLKVRGASVEEVGRLVVDRLRAVKGIERTLTCVVFETVKESQEIPLGP
ncbi:MAG: Lrp/AsnC family transcriptional regulator [Thermoproteota archaeon]|nr:MAG: Lrp/AsnC family transcriptional regulator [Candidatus Korarchaeota archaeon]